MMAARRDRRRTGSAVTVKRWEGNRLKKRQQSAKEAALSQRETTALIRLVICSSIFVLLVAAKLLLPGRMAGINQTLSEAMKRSIDVQAVFSAVGDLFTEDGAPEQTADEVYQAVFHPETGKEKVTAPEGDLSGTMTEGKDWQERMGDSMTEEMAAKVVAETELILYSDEELPENVSMQQMILNFDHATPVKGTMSSCFGYREHPTEGGERFHYGIDLAADAGTAITCFADGTVTAVGESSSYGKYCTVTHDNGCSTLYAHCSRITVSSGAAVKEGDKLGEVGETGMATGPHLHFELQKDGVYLNPIYYVETA